MGENAEKYRRFTEATGGYLMALGDTDRKEGAVKPSSIEHTVFEQALSAYRMTTIPLNMTRRWENNASGQPTSEGYGAKDLSEDSEGWLLFKNTYDGDGFITKSEVGYGSWTGRAGVSYG